jgi:hypothetical protein
MEWGFHQGGDPTQPSSVDGQRSLPGCSWLTQTRRRLDRGLLTTLLASTVHALHNEIPGLGEVISFDAKYLSAWGKEHNERASVPDRSDNTHDPAGDPDGTVGVACFTTRERADGTTEEKKERNYSGRLEVL